MHKVAEKPMPADAGSDDTLASLVLARIASAARPVDKGEIAADLSVFAAAQVPASRWRAAVERAIGALKADGQVAPRLGGFEATPSGTAAAAKFLGIAAGTPPSSSHVMGTETGAPGRARVEKAATDVAPR